MIHAKCILCWRLTPTVDPQTSICSTCQAASRAREEYDAAEVRDGIAAELAQQGAFRDADEDDETTDDQARAAWMEMNR